MTSISSELFSSASSKWNAFRSRLQSSHETSHPDLSKIEAVVKEKAAALNIKKSITVKYEKAEGLQQGYGSNFSAYTIKIDPDYFANDEERNFAVAHEVAHIKCRDDITIPSMGFFISGITILALSILIPGWQQPAMIVSAGVGILALAIFGRWREWQADKTALSICSSEERKAGAEFFKRIRQKNIDYRNEPGNHIVKRLWRKIKINTEGESRFDFRHPSLKARIQLIENFRA